MHIQLQAMEEQISDTEEYITVDLDSKRNMLFEARSLRKARIHPAARKESQAPI